MDLNVGHSVRFDVVCVKGLSLCKWACLQMGMIQQLEAEWNFRKDYKRFCL